MRPERATGSDGWGYTVSMPKLSVYLSDDVYEAVRRYEIPVSSVAQAALQAEVVRRANGEWITRALRRQIRTVPIDTSAVLDEVRDEFGA